MKRLLPLLLLTACTTTPLTIPVLQGGSVVAVPQPSPIKTSPVHWAVLDAAELQTLAAQLKANPDQPFVLYSLDTANFSNLTLNLNELRRYIEQQQAALKFAEAVIKQSTAAVAPQK